MKEKIAPGQTPHILNSRIVIKFRNQIHDHIFFYTQSLLYMLCILEYESVVKYKNIFLMRI